MVKEKRKAGRPKKKHAGGRPTKMVPLTIKKLEEAFAMGCTDLEACLYADITPPLLYAYQKDNPAFLNRKLLLKENPVLKARQTVTGDLAQVDTAKWYLERKVKREFAVRTEVTGEDGEAIKIVMGRQEAEL